jgi:hypothetical protein
LIPPSSTTTSTACLPRLRSSRHGRGASEGQILLGRRTPTYAPRARIVG